MAVLGGATGLSAGDVAQRTAMDKVQVSRAIARLVENKRVQRVVDAADGRVARLSLTAKGRAIYDEVAPLGTRTGSETSRSAVARRTHKPRQNHGQARRAGGASLARERADPRFGRHP